ncbi:MAG: copper chaperone PCu(A)C [Pseudomonadota bacterium]
MKQLLSVLGCTALLAACGNAEDASSTVQSAEERPAPLLLAYPNGAGGQKAKSAKVVEQQAVSEPADSSEPEQALAAPKEMAAMDAPAVTVTNAVVRAPMWGQSVAAAFLDIENAAAAGDKLLGVKTSAAGVVEIHTMEDSDGVMRMRKLNQLDVPAGERVALEKGGAHLMLFEIAGDLAPGDETPLTLTFEKAGEMEVVAKVVSPAALDAGAQAND